ncbi:PREDICTED: uncharacterized protein LOC105454619 isoform X2 [Wasmannia auropunctata]|nr:PREDICTED: uncharacterized protein LOC105454619 isoform X2 [Wasmannia auropunctata]
MTVGKTIENIDHGLDSILSMFPDNKFDEVNERPAFGEMSFSALKSRSYQPLLQKSNVESKDQEIRTTNLSRPKSIRSIQLNAKSKMSEETITNVKNYFQMSSLPRLSRSASRSRRLSRPSTRSPSGSRLPLRSLFRCPSRFPSRSTTRTTFPSQSRYRSSVQERVNQQLDEIAEMYTPVILRPKRQIPLHVLKSELKKDERLKKDRQSMLQFFFPDTQIAAEMAVQ